MLGGESGGEEGYGGGFDSQCGAAESNGDETGLNGGLAFVVGRAAFGTDEDEHVLSDLSAGQGGGDWCGVVLAASE